MDNRKKALVSLAVIVGAGLVAHNMQAREAVAVIPAEPMEQRQAAQNFLETRTPDEMRQLFGHEHFGLRERAQLPSRHMKRASDQEIFEKVRAIVDEFEGNRLTAYQLNGQWLIGRGVATVDGQLVYSGQQISPTKSDEEMDKHIRVHFDLVMGKLRDVPMTAMQYAIIIDLSYNGIDISKLAGCIKAGYEAKCGRPIEGAPTVSLEEVPDCILRYDAGSNLGGLLRRRAFGARQFGAETQLISEAEKPKVEIKAPDLTQAMRIPYRPSLLKEVGVAGFKVPSKQL